MHLQYKWVVSAVQFKQLFPAFQAAAADFQVWKRDSSMRVDGTLMGVDEENKKMIPQWRRGHFSMLFDASTQPASVFICDHEKKLFANMATQKKVRDMDAEVGLSFACRCTGQSPRYFSVPRLPL